MTVVALTGSIGSGKSTVASLLQSLGATVVDADVLAREVVVVGSKGLAAVRKAFGDEILLPDGSLNRKSLGSIVFTNPTERKRLEEILHPLIRQRYLEEVRRFLAVPTADTTLFVYVVPLLFESKSLPPFVTSTVCVEAPESHCIERIMERDGLTEAQARARLEAQLPIADKVAKADRVITNDGSLAELGVRVKKLYQDLLMRSS